MRLILFFFKCIVGLLATLGLLTVLLGVALGLGWREIMEWRTAAPEVPEASLLTLDLSQGVVERQPSNPLALASGRRGVNLHESVAALDRAAEDDRVEALLVRLGRGGLGMAQTQELRAAILRFREAGKPAIAFAETFGEGGNGTLHGYLSSAFDEVWLQPSGEFGMTGFIVESPFFADALESIGVEARFDQRAEYKGVADRFVSQSLPEPQRENLQQLLDSWTAQISEDVAATRGLEASGVRQLIDRSPLTAEQAREAGLVHQLGYLAEMETALQERFGEEAELLALDDYAERVARQDEDAREDGGEGTAPARIAVIYAQGAVMLAESENDPFFGRLVMGSDTIAPALLEAARDEDIEAIVLRIDSPGGSYVASDAIWAAVKAARAMGKPVVASLGDIAASGGYYAAMGAEAIVAQPGTVTGSIGVASGKFVLEGLWEQLGVTFEGVQSGANADVWSPNADFDEQGWATMQEMLDRTYADFAGKVASERGLSSQEIDTAARGRVWSGRDDLEMGLVDRLGGLREAARLGGELAGVDPERRIEPLPYPTPEDPLEMLLRNALAGRVESPAVTAAVEPLARALEAIVPISLIYQRLTADPRSENLSIDAMQLAPRP